jgi:hypothetical protein
LAQEERLANRRFQSFDPARHSGKSQPHLPGRAAQRAHASDGQKSTDVVPDKDIYQLISDFGNLLTVINGVYR